MLALPVPVAGSDIQDNAAIGGAPEALREALAAAAAFTEASKSAATRRAYAADWADFSTWCTSVEVEPFRAGPAIIAAYLSACTSRGLSAATIRRRVSAITFAFRGVNLPSPTEHPLVKAAHKGIRNTIGTRHRQVAPATADVVGKLIKRLPATLAGKRDRALLLMGFAGALRRSELVALDFEDIARAPGGIVITIRRSKTDQEGRGQQVGIPNGSKLKPVDALFAWTEAAGITSGPLFRRVRRGDVLTAERLTGHAVAEIVKRWAAKARLDPTQFSGHSMRAGFCTTALEAKADVFVVADQGRWKRLETVREYDRRRKLVGQSFI